MLGSVLDEGINYSFVDAKVLFEYGFNNFTLKTVLEKDSIVSEVKVKSGKGTDRILLFSDRTVQVLYQIRMKLKVSNPASRFLNLLRLPSQRERLLGT